MLEESIFKSVCKMLGLPEDGGGFEQNVAASINSALMVVQQIGVTHGIFQITDATQKWSEMDLDDAIAGMVRTYVFLRVAFEFDPPVQAFLATAKKEQLAEYEVRLNTYAEVGPNG